ncbi:MAG: TlpA family protein disulfide reductase [Flavobacteriaceae bacterium]|nr:TlpA family protein disulfide reductase [Flavobacteriaceae bacterium]
MKLQFKSFLLVFIFISIHSFAQKSPIKVGNIAPKIHFDKTFSLNYKIPKDKVIVLDFWATWCGPCVASLIKTNELVEKYKTKVDFIAITDNSSKNIKLIIEKRGFKHKFILDNEGKTHQRYGVGGIPMMFVISSNGKVAWKGRHLNDSILNQIITNRKISFKQKNKKQITQTKTIKKKKNSLKKLEIKISETSLRKNNNERWASYNWKRGKIQFNLFSTKGIFEMLKNQNYRLIIDENCKMPELVSIDFQSNGIFENKNDANRYILESIGKYLNIDVQYKTELTNTYTLIVADSLKLAQHKTSMTNKSYQSEDIGAGSYLGTSILLNVSLSSLAKAIEEHFNVITEYEHFNSDNTGYDFINLKMSTLDELKADLANRFGLKLKIIKKNIDFIYVGNK